MSKLHREAKAYYALVAEARRRGIPTSLDDPRSPRSVRGLHAQIRRAAIRRSLEEPTQWGV